MQKRGEPNFNKLWDSYTSDVPTCLSNTNCGTTEGQTAGATDVYFTQVRGMKLRLRGERMRGIHRRSQEQLFVYTNHSCIQQCECLMFLAYVDNILSGWHLLRVMLRG